MKPKQQEKTKEATCRATQGNWQQMNRKQRREMTRKIQSEDIRLEVVHCDAAGIDIGNESHYVAVPPSRDNQPVRCFGCTTSKLISSLWICRIVSRRCLRFICCQLPCVGRQVAFLVFSSCLGFMLTCPR